MDFCRERLVIEWEAGMPDPIDELLHGPAVVVNVGLRGFSGSLEAQEVDVVQVDWVPPAGGIVR